jgi:hypothetical protein
VVHEIGNAGDGLCRNVEAVDQARLGAWGRGHRDGLPVVDVEREPNRDAALSGGRQSARDEPRGRLLEVEVVEGEVECLPSAREKFADVLGDLERALSAVRECADLDRQAYPRTRR